MKSAHDFKNLKENELRGKIVFIGGGYGSGEYIILRNSRNVLYCVKPVGGYDGHEVKTFNLLATEPKDKYEILDSYDSPNLIRKTAEDLEYFSKSKERGEKPNWIESVYTGAATVARQLKDLAQEMAQTTTPTPNVVEYKLRTPKGENLRITIEQCDG